MSRAVRQLAGGNEVTEVLFFPGNSDGYDRFIHYLRYPLFGLALLFHCVFSLPFLDYDRFIHYLR